MRPLLIVATLALGLTALSLSIAAAQSPPPPTAETVVGQQGHTVGDAITVVVTVRHHPAITVEAPPGVATLGDVEPAVPVGIALRILVDGDRLLTLTYETRAFRTGRLAVQPPDLVVRTADGAQRTLTPPATTVEVESVLPPGATLDELTPRALKPALDIQGAGAPFTWIGAGGGGAAALLLIALLFRRVTRRRRAPAAAPAAPPSPAQSAVDELVRIDTLSLLPDRVDEFCARIQRALRAYLATAYHLPAGSLTSGELPDRLLQAGADPRTATLVGRLYSECDAVAYAGARPAPSRARGYLELAISIVRPPDAARWARPGPGSDGRAQDAPHDEGVP